MGAALRLKCGLVALALASMTASGRAQDTSSQGPQLKIEPGMHTAQIARIGVSADGRLLATASWDKTVRLWSLPDGKLVRTLRVPIGQGHEGKVYAVALAPDGRWLAAGGITKYVYIFDTNTGAVTDRLPVPLANGFGAINDLAVSADGKHLAAGFLDHYGISVWTRDGEGWQGIADTDYRGEVYGLDFAADGRLASTSLDGFLRLYRTDPKLLHKLTPVRKVKAPDGKHPYGIAFSPDGKRLAVGYVDTPSVDVFRSDKLTRIFPAPDTTGINSGDVATVTWFAGGRRLAAGGSFRSMGRAPILVWEDGGLGRREMLDGSSGAVRDLVPVRIGTSDEGLAFGSIDPAFGLFNSDGQRVFVRGPRQWPSSTLRNLLVSADGKRVWVQSIQNPGGSDDSWGFDVAATSLATLSPTIPGDLERAETEGLPIHGLDTSRPTLGKKALTLAPWEYPSSLAIAPDKQSFVLGSNFGLRRFDKQGNELWPGEQEAPDGVLGVNLADHGNLIIAYYGDGTIRWHRAEDGKELLALFIYVPEDREAEKRWILWTPKGYYTASPGGEDLIGWHVNRGPDEAADFFSVGQFRDQFYRPDIVGGVLDMLDEATAIESANRKRHISPVIIGGEVHPKVRREDRPSAKLDDANCNEIWSLTEREDNTLSEAKAAPYVMDFKLIDVDRDGKLSEAEFEDGCKKGLIQAQAATPQNGDSRVSAPPEAAEDFGTNLPPVVTVLRLHDGDPVTSAGITVPYAVRSPSGLPVTRVFALVDGLPVKEAEAKIETQAPANEETRGVLKIKVPEQVKASGRDFKLSIIAEAKDLASEPATVQLHWMGPPAPVEPPVLYALIIGVGHYDKNQYDLGDFPSRDADELAKQLSEQKGLAFRDVRIRVLKDRQKDADELDRDWFQRTDGKKAASATRDNLIAGLQWLKNEVQDARDIALVFFSGHGRTESGTSYLLPVDFDPENDLSTTLDKAMLRGALRGINGNKLLVVDACYAGKDVLDTTDLGNDLGQPKYSIMTIASSLGTERSYADDKGSFFARALIEALRGLDAESAADGKITTAEFAPWAKRRVKDLMKDPNASQTPFVLKPALWTDDLRLAVVPQ